jgi:hypothetical protein
MAWSCCHGTASHQWKFSDAGTHENLLALSLGSMGHDRIVLSQMSRWDLVLRQQCVSRHCHEASQHCVKKVKALACRFILCTSVSTFGTQREHNFWKWSLSDTILWRNGETSVLLNLLFHCTHKIFINHIQSATPQIIMHIFTSLIEVSHPSPYHWVTHSWHSKKLTMNVSWIHVSCIQETDYRPHFKCGGLLDFLEHYKHTGQCVNTVQLSANRVCDFPKEQQTLHACAPLWPQHCNICKQTYFVDMPHIKIMKQSSLP